MTITYHIDKSQNLIVSTWKGRIEASAVRAYFTELLANLEASSICRSLADLREAELVFKGHELGDILQRDVRPLTEGSSWKVAILVNNLVQFGVARQYAIQADFFCESAVFYDSDKAMGWLDQA